jgi:hypothetical protein
MEELYNGMAVQLGYRDSSYWADRVSTAEAKIAEDMEKSEIQQPSQENTSNDLNELYNGMAIQTGYHDSPYWNDRVSTAQ